MEKDKIIESILNSMELNTVYEWHMLYTKATGNTERKKMLELLAEMEQRNLIENKGIEIDTGKIRVGLKTIGERLKLKINQERLEALDKIKNTTAPPKANDIRHNPKIWSMSSISFWLIIPFLSGLLILIVWFLLSKFWINPTPQ